MGKGTGGGCGRKPIALQSGGDMSTLRQAALNDLISVAETTYTTEINPHSELVSDEFADYFGFRLGMYESLTGERLQKTAFEDAFAKTLHHTGHTVTKPDSMTNPGHDLTINGVRWSLKTEGAKQLRQGMIFISKFMECAGIRNFSSTKDALAKVQAIRDHLGRYERIIMLRSWPEEHPELGMTTRYELVEIPKNLFDSLDNLKPTDFSPLTETKTTRAPMKLGDEAVGMLRFDGSDEKITLSRIRVDLCTRHATWWIPRAAGLGVDEPDPVLEPVVITAAS